MPGVRLLLAQPDSLVVDDGCIVPAVLPTEQLRILLPITPMRHSRRGSILPSKCHVLPSHALHLTRSYEVFWSRKAVCPRRRLLNGATLRDTLPITMCP